LIAGQHAERQTQCDIISYNFWIGPDFR
jgi:hypothetical protein